MLHSLRIKNFYSFQEEQIISLEAPKSVAGDSRFASTGYGKNTALTAVIFGANASGKTNLLRALVFLNWFIRDSWTALRPDELIRFWPFQFNSGDGSKTSLGLCAEDSKGAHYKYDLELDKKQVFSESLRFKDAGKSVFSHIFQRCGDNFKIFPKSGFKASDIPKKALRPNASLISAALQSGLNVFTGFLQSFNVVSNLDSSDISYNDEAMLLDKLYSNADLKDLIVATIAKCNAGIDAINITRKEATELEKHKIINTIKNNPFIEIDDSFLNGRYLAYNAEAVHVVGGQQFKLPLHMESNGIRALLPLLVKILTALRNGGIVVYDEIEKGLHPQLVHYILDLFYDEDINSGRAQLLCTSHSADCMNFLEKYQIIITDKDSLQASRAYRLSDLRGVRKDDNYMQKYLAGAYGGTPELTEAG